MSAEVSLQLAVLGRIRRLADSVILVVLLSFTVPYTSVVADSQVRRPGLTAQVYYDTDPRVPAAGHGIAEPSGRTRGAGARKVAPINHGGFLTIDRLGQGMYTLTIIPDDKQYEAVLVAGIVVGEKDEDLGEIILPKKKNLPRVSIYGRVYDARHPQGRLPQAKIKFPHCPKQDWPVGEDGSFQIQGLQCADYGFTISAARYISIPARVLVETSDAFSMEAKMEAEVRVGATLSGTVSDPTGAVAPGTTITAENVDTRATRTTSSDASGSYFLPELPPGNYKLTAEKQGFRKEIHSEIVLTVGEEKNIDLTLTVGALSEVVLADARPLLETDNATMGGVVGQKLITELPLSGEHVPDLVESGDSRGIAS